MTLALDANVLVHWTVAGTTAHDQARRILDSERDGGAVALTHHVCLEFLHVVTDARRFEKPLSVSAAIERIRLLWRAPETVHVIPSASVLLRAVELMAAHGLGRRRILDTFLAASLEEARIARLATFNPGDFRVFPFLEVIDANT